MNPQAILLYACAFSSPPPCDVRKGAGGRQKRLVSVEKCTDESARADESRPGGSDARAREEATSETR